MSEPIAVLEIIQPGALTSIQDLGRKGYQRLGIAEAGAMDTISFVAANRLVGNPDNAAGLEVTDSWSENEMPFGYHLRTHWCGPFGTSR